MAENYIDYEVVEASAQSYSQQAEALGAVLQTLAGTNDALQGGFKNQTATAFIERYDSEYKVALEKAQEALLSISEFLTTYMNNRMEEDNATAGSVTGG